MTENMEVDPVMNDKLELWFSPGILDTASRVQFAQLDLSSLTVDNLKELIATKQPSVLIDSIDLLYNGQIIGTGNAGSSTLATIRVKAGSVLNVVKKFEVKNSAAGSSQKTYSPEQLHQIAVALRTGFLSPAFGKTIEKLTEPDMLENIFAIAPGLVTDLIGIAIIQSPHMIFHTSEPEAFSKLAETRPWVIEAFNFIAAAIHLEKGTDAPQFPRQLMISQLLNPAVLEGDDEDMDEEEDDENEVSRSQSQPNLITREQLSQALSSIPLNRGTGSPASGSGRGGGPFAALFGNASSSRPATAPASSQPSGQNTAPNFQNLLQSAMAAVAGGTDGPQLTPEAVSRAMQDALGRLPPEQRASQLNALRDMALQLTGGGSLSSGVMPVSTPPVTQPQPPASAYQGQLRQMRELGFTDDRLSTLALRVSNGDVETAAELLFSGWDGAGADPEGGN